MKLRKFYEHIYEGTILDELRAEQDKKDSERIKREAEADSNIKKNIQTHIANKEQEPISNLTDYNTEKTEIVDKIGDIFIHSMNYGDEEPKKEILALIDKYSKYLKNLSNSEIEELIKTGKVKKIELPTYDIPKGDFLQKGIVQKVKTKKELNKEKPFWKRK
jgi:hypothetical protein